MNIINIENTEKNIVTIENIKEAYTFDDVLLEPCYSEILPSEANTQTFLTKDLELNIPIISASMDSVTESSLAIELAKHGGIGVIHKNMSIAQQAKEIKKVKKYESWIVSSPLTISPEDSIKNVLALKKKHNYSSLPVVDKNNKLLGILTNRDIRFIEDESIKVSEVMTTENLITAPLGISHTEAIELLHRNKIERLIIIDSNNICVGLITVKDIEKFNKYPQACKDKKSRLRVAGTIGIGPLGIERAIALIEQDIDAIVIDTAHGHTKIMAETIKEIKKRFSTNIIAGNIVTKEGAQFLIDAGADAVKVGVGPGSICTTRVIAGTGKPQLSAIIDVANIAKKHNIKVIADGGIRYSGDIAKAIAAGADSVMIGSLFAGASEAPGETVLYQGRSYKSYRGMGSLGAMNEGSADRYAQKTGKKLVPEGVEGLVPFKGALSEILFQLIGGLRSAMGYTGSPNIQALQRNAKFIKITNAGFKESHPHNVLITNEAPNYQ